MAADESSQGGADSADDDRRDTTDQSRGDDETEGSRSHVRDDETEGSRSHNGDDETEGSRSHVRDDETPQSRHPQPWTALDYRASRPTDERWQDTSTPAGVPDVETSQTGFDPSDAPPEFQAYYEWLDELNHGVGASERSTQHHRGGIVRDLGVVTGQLSCTDRQHDRAAWLLDRLDIKGDVLPDGPIEVAVVAVVSLAVDEDRTRLAHHEDAKAQSVLRDTAFARLLDEYDITRRQVRQARVRVRETDVYESPNES